MLGVACLGALSSMASPPEPNPGPLKKIFSTGIQSGTLYIDGELITPPYTIAGEFQLIPDTLWTATLVNDRPFWRRTAASASKRNNVEASDSKARSQIIFEGKQFARQLMSQGVQDSAAMIAMIEYLQRTYPSEIDSVVIHSRIGGKVYFNGRTVARPFTLRDLDSLPSDSTLHFTNGSPPDAERIARLLRKGSVIVKSEGIQLTFPPSQREVILAEIDSVRRGQADKTRHLYLRGVVKPFKTPRGNTK